LPLAALANVVVAAWHLYLADKLNPAIPFAESVRVAVFAGALTLAGVALCWRLREARLARGRPGRRRT
jgi:hypothetical protein